MDDRILIVPPDWAPAQRAHEDFAATRSLWRRLEAFLPVDVFPWPTLKGAKMRGAGAEAFLNAFRDTVRPEHHVLDLGSASAVLLVVLSEQPARSVTAVGFFPSPAMLEGMGRHDLAATMRLVYTIASDPAQVLGLLMQGADPGQIKERIDSLEAVLDRRVLLEYARESADIDWSSRIELSIPALYLSTTLPMTGAGEMEDVFCRLVPHARTDTLTQFGPHIHEEAGGHELADKVIPFIQEVIAQQNRV